MDHASCNRLATLVMATTACLAWIELTANLATPTFAWSVNPLPTEMRRSSPLLSLDRPSILPHHVRRQFSPTRGLGCTEIDDREISDEEDLENSAVLPVSGDEDDPPPLPRGVPDGFFVTKHHSVPDDLDVTSLTVLNMGHVERLNLSSSNMTLPIALMMLFPTDYPSLSRARKACRKWTVLLHRGPLSHGGAFDPLNSSRGRVGDRIYPGDVIGQQERMSHGGYSPFLSHTKPSFDLPVVYEDDHFAIVNKPAGVLVYEEGGKGRNNIRYALPYVLEPPKIDANEEEEEALRRPQCAHRLDKPTSGLLVVGKTKSALSHITRQFEERKVQKTYTAILNGKPAKHSERNISSKEVKKLGVDVDVDDNDTVSHWQIASNLLDGKEAVTIWRIVESFQSTKADDGHITLVELKPKTGRYHQLRRQMALLYECPIVGDATYGIKCEYDKKKWGRGLMLCSNRLTLRHPYFNTAVGREEWERLKDGEEKYGNGAMHLSEDGEVMVSVSIDIPTKFEKFIAAEVNRATYHSE